MDDLQNRSPHVPAHLRTAGPDDLGPAARVYQAAARSLHARLRAHDQLANESARQRDFRDAVRALTTLSDREDGAVIVADVGHDLAGVGAVRIQDRHAHIGFLFVMPGFQERGIGRQILDRLSAIATDAGAETLSLIASRDPRAWQRYLRLGLRPGSSVLSLRATRPRFPTDVPDTDTTLTVEPLDPDLLAHQDIIDRLDLDVRGSRRRSDVQSWLRSGDTGALFTDSDTGSTIGYAIIGQEPDHVRLGPVVSRSADRFADVLAHTLHLARCVEGASRHPWRVDLPATNELAVAPLLDAGFVVTALQPWFATGKIGQWDRYIFRSEDEL